MIYDCFTFFNELDLLEIRLNVLKDVVDKFVLVEARQTHSGTPKPLWYDENKARFAAFKDRIVHLVVESFPADADSWGRENIQRNFIAEGLKECQDGDVILISDLDEIPNPCVFPVELAPGEICLLEQGMYYYFLNYRDRGNPIWQMGTKVMTYRTFCHGLDAIDVPYSIYMQESINCGTTATKIRLYQSCRHIPNGGWHFSYLGGVDAIVRKLRSFSHQEYDTERYLDRRHLMNCILKGRDLFDRPGKVYIPEPFERGRFPDYVVNERTRYADLILTVNGIGRLYVWVNRIYLVYRSLWAVGGALKRTLIAAWRKLSE